MPVQKADAQDLWVHLIPQQDYDLQAMVPKLRRVFEKEKVDVRNKTVMLKVSFVFPVRNPERTKMINTNNNVIAAVCQVLGEQGASRIYIADGETIGPARYAYAMVQIKKTMRQIPADLRKKVVYAYLDECHKEWVTPADPVVPGIKLDYPTLARNVDVFISMPKLKVNLFANITLSVKNGMGFVQTNTRLKYHNHNLHGLIADIYQVRPPDYVITDAIYAGEGQGPMAASPHPTNLLLFGNNGLAVDATCCYLMGFDPYEINHLKFLHQRRYGPLELDQFRIETREILESRKHTFTRPVVSMDNLAPNIHYYAGEVCDCGCPAMIRAMMDSYGERHNWDWTKVGEMNIIIGKNPPITREEARKLKKRRTVVYGNCAREYRKYGNYYPGCTPNHVKAMISYTYKAGWGPVPWIKYVNPFTFLFTNVAYALAWLGGKKYKPSAFPVPAPGERVVRRG